MVKNALIYDKNCGNLCHISKRRELVPYFGKSLPQLVIGAHTAPELHMNLGVINVTRYLCENILYIHQ